MPVSERDINLSCCQKWENASYSLTIVTNWSRTSAFCVFLSDSRMPPASSFLSGPWRGYLLLAATAYTVVYTVMAFQRFVSTWHVPRLRLFSAILFPPGADSVSYTDRLLDAVLALRSTSSSQGCPRSTFWFIFSSLRLLHLRKSSFCLIFTSHRSAPSSQVSVSLPLYFLNRFRLLFG